MSKSPVGLPSSWVNQLARPRWQPRLSPPACEWLLGCWLGLLASAALAQQPTISQGEDFYSQGDYKQALNAFESALKANPSDALAQQGEVKSSAKLALTARAQGDYNGALTVLLHARSLVPHDGTLLLDLGVLEDEMQLYRDADLALAEALQIQPRDPQTLYAVARVKLDLQQLPAAESNMRAYLQTQPQDPTAHYGLGRVLQLAQRSQEAEAEFQRSIQLQPKQTESYFQLGQLALDQGRLEGAVRYFDQVIVANPRHGGALTGAGQARYRQKQFAPASDYLSRAVAAAPTYQPAHYYYGLTLLRLGHTEQSKRELQLASALSEEQNRREARPLELNGAIAPVQLEPARKP
jgi:tetratricopeptide (TPR) repeat protein